nr:hypothetical protein [uncultured Campylobacter sp.]
MSLATIWMKISAKFIATKFDLSDMTRDRCRFDRKYRTTLFAAARKFRRSKHTASLNLDKLSATIEFRSVKSIVIPNLKLI